MRTLSVLLLIIAAAVAVPSFAPSFVLEIEAANATFTFAWDSSNERIAEWMETNGPKKQAAVAVVTPVKGYEVVGFDVYPLNVSCCTQSIPQSNTIGSFWDAKEPFTNTTCGNRQYPTCYIGSGTATEPSRLPEMVWCFDITGRPACGGRLDNGEVYDAAVVTSYLPGIPPSIFFQVPPVYGSCSAACANDAKAASLRLFA